LAPDLAEAHSALGVIHLFFEWDWQSAEREFRRGLNLNPSDGVAYHWYGHYLSFMGRSEEAVRAFEGALRLDPLSAFHRNCLGVTYLIAGDLERGAGAIGKALELSPEYPLALYYLGWTHERQGRLPEAVLAWEKAAGLEQRRVPYSLATVGYGYGRLGQHEKARAVLRELEHLSRDRYVAAGEKAKIFAGLRDFDRAFRWLEKAYADREPWVFGLKLDPGYDTLRADPRFEALLRRIGVRP